MQVKRRHFNVKDTETANYKDTIEWMRFNAERERIDKFKKTVSESASVYYMCVEQF